MILANLGAFLTMLGFGLAYLVVAVPLDLPPMGALAPVVVGAIVGVRVGQAWCMAWSRRFARKAFAERGMTDPVPVSYRVDETALIHSSGPVEMRIPWSAVSDIVAAGPYWVLLCIGATPIYLPRRFFPDPEAESDFLGAVLDRMSPDAVARSREAAAIAGR